MKRKIQLGFAGLAFSALVSLFLPASAQAADYNGSCAGISSFNGTGNVTLTVDANCTLSNNLTATGYIYINASGTVNTKTLTGSNVLVIAGSTLETGAIKSATGGIVDLKSQVTSGTAAFIIGGTGNSNGVNGTITATGSGDNPIYASSIVFITNTGDITLKATTNINVLGASGSRAGSILLNAVNGNVNIPSGTMSVSSTAGGGQIDIAANQVNFSGSVTLNASQSASAAPVNHQVNISASTISYGTALTINADGNGGSVQPASVTLTSAGSLSFTDTEDPADLIIISTLSPGFPGPLSVTGTGALIVTANGNNSLVLVGSGEPTTFKGTNVTLQSQGQGATNHQVQILNNQISGILGLQFANTGTTIIDASGSTTWGANPAGGLINMYVDQAQFTSKSVAITANATSGNAAGGTIRINSSNFNLTPTSTGSTIAANGIGTSYGGDIQITSIGSAAFNLGTATGQFTLSAKGGASGGSGGSIYVTNDESTPNGSVSIGSSTAVTVTASGTGTGGTITLLTGALTINGTATSIAANGGPSGDGGFIAFQTDTFNTSSAASITANGGTTKGNGGTIELTSTNAINIGNTSGTVSLAANAPKSGNGGTISLMPGVQTNTINTAQLTATATGQGNGGSISYMGGPLTINGSLNTNGAGNGNGGTLSLTAGYFTFTGTQSFTANSLGTGTGGTVTINSTNPGNSAPLNLGASTTLQAKSASDAGGTINIISASQPVNITGAGLLVTAGGSGTGGSISVTASANTITVTGALSADGSGSGNAGKITLTGGLLAVHLWCSIILRCPPLAQPLAVETVTRYLSPIWVLSLWRALHLMLRVVV